jgi:hypothetical protein
MDEEEREDKEGKEDEEEEAEEGEEEDEVEEAGKEEEEDEEHATLQLGLLAGKSHSDRDDNDATDDSRDPVSSPLLPEKGFLEYGTICTSSPSSLSLSWSSRLFFLPTLPSPNSPPPPSLSLFNFSFKNPTPSPS